MGQTPCFSVKEGSWAFNSTRAIDVMSAFHAFLMLRYARFVFVVMPALIQPHIPKSGNAALGWSLPINKQ